jgi:hypothetical protein
MHELAQASSRWWGSCPSPPAQKLPAAALRTLQLLQIQPRQLEAYTHNHHEHPNRRIEAFPGPEARNVSPLKLSQHGIAKFRSLIDDN